MTMKEQAILTELHSLPENLRLEVLHYILFLKSKCAGASNQFSGKKRVFGIAKGKYEMSDDFDEPLDELKAYM